MAGDSLLVMNSLLEKEGLGGQVQMIYIDPPYGIRYGSNFQPFVNKREVRDRSDADLTREPETIRAFRDTWEMGIHSYLTYLRDRLLLAKEMLHESGSVFVQISDENVHRVRMLMDDVFGAANLLGEIVVEKTSSATSNTLPTVNDYLVWYARDRAKAKYRQIFLPKVLGERGTTQYVWYESDDRRQQRRLSSAELNSISSIPSKGRVFACDNLTSMGAASSPQPYDFNGKTFWPSANAHWKPTHPHGMKQLERARRFVPIGNSLMYKRYLDDFPVSPITNIWSDTKLTGFAERKTYAVQTAVSVIERCLLMTTDPGDLIVDPTCGSGTTAFVAEQWGRRWITCDTSRVAVTLARQRLMTSVYDYYQLAHPDEGVGSGFKYKTVPHVTLGSIANNPDIREGMTQVEIDAAIARHAPQETLYDMPLVDRTKRRVTGPFTVEAVPAPVVRPLVDNVEFSASSKDCEQGDGDTSASSRSLESTNLQPTVGLARSGETVRQSDWRDELLKTGIRGKSGQRIAFSRLEPQPGTRWLHAVGETQPDASGADGFREAPTAYMPQRVAVSFGPDHAPLEQRQVERAWEEARTLNPHADLLVFAAFQFDPEAAKDIDELDPALTGMQFLKAQMNADLLTDDLKRKRASNESFWLIGQPDVEVYQIRKGQNTGKWQVEVRGFDYFNTRTGGVESGDEKRIAMWMLDPDYDGRSLFPRQVFFPMAGSRDGWARLARNLKAEIDTDLIEAYRSNVSLPFGPGEHRRIAVKIVDDRGIESLRIIAVGR